MALSNKYIVFIALALLLGGAAYLLMAQSKEKDLGIGSDVKSSVPAQEIISGGPPKDGIPPIDNPKFVSIAEAQLGDEEPGIAFSRGNTHRFYPYQILVWHEIVNDTVPALSGVEGGGERVLVTYCPLCLSGFVFDPVVKGERVEFGTSGKLWKSNLVMYDRKTDSLWSQILGEAIAGEMTGTKLAVLPSDLTRFGDWKKKFPQGEVLSRDTGTLRFYGQNPYGDYFEPVDFALSLAGVQDTRLAPDEFIFGLVVNGKAKAYPTKLVQERGEVADVFEGQTFVLRHDKELDAVRVFKKLEDGTEERINPFSAFWFSWAAAHPNTEVFQ
ncbi:MAG: DUF3179 domain-containing protein [Candidatus Wildermuthbacteria bacterium]|nr:DUF3179 domain-containing protein [Candidatus Wildermuthbacteria bacterium]